MICRIASWYYFKRFRINTVHNVEFFVTTDFLRYAPCMRKVKNEYEHCTESYKNTMKKIQEKKSAEYFTTTTTTSTTTFSPRLVQINLMKRQQSSQSIYVSLEASTVSSKNISSDAIDQGDVQIKTVCWWVQEERNNGRVRNANDFITVPFKNTWSAARVLWKQPAELKQPNLHETSSTKCCRHWFEWVLNWLPFSFARLLINFCFAQSFIVMNPRCVTAKNTHQSPTESHVNSILC